MGFFDYVGDLYAAISIQPTDAEQPKKQFEGPTDTSGEQTSDTRAKDTDEVGTAHHDRGATTRGGVSLDTPAAGTGEESGPEADANRADEEKSKQRASSEPAAGHAPGDGGEGSGQKGPMASGPNGGPVRAAAGSDDSEDEDGGDEEEEDEEEEEEPEDPKPRLEEECMKTQQCAPLKHHYDECAERVQHQQEQNGKADEDCVEEFFHLMHCASQCAAPKLFRQLR